MGRLRFGRCCVLTILLLQVLLLSLQTRAEAQSSQPVRLDGDKGTRRRQGKTRQHSRKYRAIRAATAHKGVQQGTAGQERELIAVVPMDVSAAADATQAQLAAAADAAAAVAQTQPGEQGRAFSSVEVSDETLGPYYIFHNVLLRKNNSIVFFDPPTGVVEGRSPVQLPKSIKHRPAMTPFGFDRVDSNPPPPGVKGPLRETCLGWARKPAMLVDAAPWTDNVFHFYNDFLMPVFQTANQHGWVPEAQYADGQRVPNPQESPVTLIALTPWPYKADWSYLTNFITSDQRTIESAGGLCYETLVVEVSTLLNWYINREGDWWTQRSEALFKFQNFLSQASKLYEQSRGNWPLLDFRTSTSNGGQQRPRVTLASRTHSRGIMNEPEIISWINARYDVNVTITEFRLTPYEAMELMQHTDVFIGMHGAGMTNMLYIKPGASVVQLHPYGWQLPNGEMIRGFYYKNMVKANNAHYLEWVNPFPEKAFMREMDFPPQNPNTPYQYALHPLPEWGTPQTYEPPLNWIYQHTVVDLPNITPIFEKAFQLANILPKASAVQVS
ncbi:hypothetical protein WJX72_009545 [[Myrmecia] bisecta]|uniref:Glycosyltransferase 61 catalytic domain-containing protein n=1 Tax=[Myrmecia] bisecta TaxID=41462 RepID=A0AAW1Q9X1_9CHLO